MKAYLELDEEDPIIDCLRALAEVFIPIELVDGELPEPVKCLEKFVFRVYCATGPITLPALR